MAIYLWSCLTNHMVLEQATVLIAGVIGSNVPWLDYPASNAIVTFFGYYIWLQSDGAFYYLRLDKCSFTVGMFCITRDVTRRPLGRLATACSWEGKCVSTRRAGPRGVSLSQAFDGTRPIADIWEIPLKLLWTLLTDDLALHNGDLLYD